MAKCSSCGRSIGGLPWGKNLCRWCVEYEAQKRGEGKGDEIQRVMPTPWKQQQAFGGSFNNLFILINVLVFAAMIFTGAPLSGAPGQQLLRWGSNFGPYTLGGEPWRLITYMFLHAGIIHIGMNMWCLWQLGQLAESLYGDRLYALLYLLSGIGGGLGTLWWHPHTNTVGASGAVFGVAGALIASLKLGDFSLPRPMIQGVLRNILIFSAYSLIFGAISSGTDNACHIGGFLTGAAFGALIALVAPDRDAVFSRIGVFVAVALVVLSCGAWVRTSRGFVVTAQRGEMLLQQGKVDEAIPMLQRAIQLRPDDADAHFDMAHAYLLKGDVAKERAELKRILEIDPKSELARYNLGLSYLNTNELPQAREQFSQMIAANARSGDAHVGLGLVAVADHDDEAAVKEFEAATKIDEATDAYLELGSAYLRLKKYDNAITALKTHREISGGDDYATEMALAEAYTAKGMKQEAADAAQKAKELKIAN